MNGPSTQAASSASDRGAAEVPARRAPAIVSTPEGLSAVKASRLSFLRILIQRMTTERWRITRSRFDLDERGRGLAVYYIDTGGLPLHFVVFSNELEEADRTDRIIANRYDGEAFLCFGNLTPDRIDAQRTQFADFLYGRADIETLGWTRVNRSERMFNVVVEALAAGRQPDINRVVDAGYLLRNNGYWGNGRHGSTSFKGIPEGEAISLPYHADLLTLYLWRTFSHDLVEHIATTRSACAVSLHPALKRFIGVGNASGLGLIPFVIRHPHRIHNWCAIRENVIAHTKMRTEMADSPHASRLRSILDRAIAYFSEGIQVRAGIFAGSEQLVLDLRRIAQQLSDMRKQWPALPWLSLCDWAASHTHAEALETLHSALIEIYPDLCGSAQAQMVESISGTTDLDPSQTAGNLKNAMEKRYAWALSLNLGAPEARRHFWYLSEDNLEPRHGVRGNDPKEEFETFVDVVGAVQQLYRAVKTAPPDQTIDRILFDQPNLRFTIERVQGTAGFPYGEVRANILAPEFQPCHLIRFLLAVYGMEKLDPQSHLWVRGTFLQGAPLPEDIAAGDEGDWIYPLRPVLN